MVGVPRVGGPTDDLWPLIPFMPTFTRLSRTSLALALGIAVHASSAALAQVGTNYCGPAVPNSSGLSATMSALGSADLSINANRLTLVADDLPTNQFGIFFTGRTQGFVANPGGSVGNLCVSGSIGRFRGPGQILDSGAAGRIELGLDLALTPEGAGFVQVLAGETWNYQAWFRDVAAGGAATSNFSDGLEVQFSASCAGCGPVPGMVSIPAGTFQMGSSAAPGPPYYGYLNQQPVHQVTISHSFWMGAHEVTQAEYQSVMGSTPFHFIGSSRPAEQVNWFQARAYCAALTAQNASSLPAGYEYRLPTEAEWEYACRAGTTTEFHYGAELYCNQARFGYSYHSNSSCGTALGGTLPVGSFSPNAFGLYDMHGNVWEWCLDSPAGYGAGAVTDPFVTGGSSRVIRGGSWFYNSDDCRSAFRGNDDPTNQSSGIGFRVVLAPVLVP